MTQLTNDNIRKTVREQYGKVAKSGNSSCGCSATPCCDASDIDSKVTSMRFGYSRSDVNQVPEDANMGLGCGNPKAIASLKAGETVLDLGSGGGFDCFLAVNEVGLSGTVIGVDMTPEMVSKARTNADKAGHKNVEFRLGEIENLPELSRQLSQRSNNHTNLNCLNLLRFIAPDNWRLSGAFYS